MSSRPTRTAATTSPVMLRGVQLQYVFDDEMQRGADLHNDLFDMLKAVREHGSLASACAALDISYRHLWGSLRRWETLLARPLIGWVQGKPARLTPFAERLVWNERRARARLAPHIEALRVQLARVLADSLDEQQQVLTVFASHDLALPMLREHAADALHLHLDIRFAGSVESLRALNNGRCMAAGFHVPPVRGAAPVFAAALKPLLRPGMHKLIGCSRRLQGMMVRADHASLIRMFPDVTSHGLRFVNRQVGSGTRLLTEHLLHEHALAPSQLKGYATHVEETHTAVAACVASGVADIGIGIEAAAREFGLHFIPLVEEEYFLVCLKKNLGNAAVVRLREALALPAWLDRLAATPGYSPAPRAGSVLSLTSALPWWRFKTPRKSRASADRLASAVARSER